MANLSRRIYSITGKIFSSPYDWGGTKLIPQTLGFEPEPGVPYAEYWIGAHKRAPSPVETPEGMKTLEELIKEHPEEILGREVAQEYGELPFLFKLAEARKMLSVQVHPNKQQAKEGFKEEEKTGIPATDLKRTFKDPNSKTEMPIALSDYYILHGLLAEDEMRKLLSDTKEFSPLLPYFENNDYKRLYKHILLEMSDQEVSDMLNPLFARIMPLFETGELQKTSHDYWAAKALKDFEMNSGVYDRGIFSIYFLHIVHLHPGQAIFQKAGVLHAFLEGQYIEIMQNSDNIARAGMTNKPIDIDGLMKFMIFEAQAPQLLDGNKVDNEVFYEVPADEFLVSRISPQKDKPHKQTSHSVEILMGLEGNAVIKENNVELPLGKGKSVVVFAGATYEIHGSENDTIYRVSVPQR